MCGRITQAVSPLALATDMFCDNPEELLSLLLPRYNICPTQDVAAIVPNPRADSNSLKMLSWGLIPPWSHDPAAGAKMFNARSETVDQKPAFREAFASRRCLIPVDGFYEWRKEGKTRQPIYFCRRDRSALALAGLWERWEYPANEVVESCSILTTRANLLMKPIHHRMPVIVGRADWKLWLDVAEARSDRLRELLNPADNTELIAFPVSQAVNNTNNDGPDLVEPVAVNDDTQLDLFGKKD